MVPPGPNGGGGGGYGPSPCGFSARPMHVELASHAAALLVGCALILIAFKKRIFGEVVVSAAPKQVEL